MSEEAELRVLRGQPDEAQVAALVAVLCARSTGPAPVTGYEAWRRGRLAAVRRSVLRP